ncbi:hypothetical protein BC628DRAFT_508563 [Trametes gibbosa]|nr:hypothetical protein BC628DRAFT_508563 [Trametes gibbosa]
MPSSRACSGRLPASRGRNVVSVLILSALGTSIHGPVLLLIPPPPFPVCRRLHPPRSSFPPRCASWSAPPFRRRRRAGQRARRRPARSAKREVGGGHVRRGLVAHVSFLMASAAPAFPVLAFPDPAARVRACVIARCAVFCAEFSIGQGRGIHAQSRRSAPGAPNLPPSASSYRPSGAGSRTLVGALASAVQTPLPRPTVLAGRADAFCVCCAHSPIECHPISSHPSNAVGLQREDSLRGYPPSPPPSILSNSKEAQGRGPRTTAGPRSGTCWRRSGQAGSPASGLRAGGSDLG